MDRRLPGAGKVDRSFISIVDGGVIAHIVNANTCSQFTCKGTDLDRITAVARQSPKSASAVFMQGALVFVSESDLQFPTQTIENPSHSSDFVDSNGPWLVCGNKDGYFYAICGTSKTVTFNVLPYHPSVVRVSAARNLVCVGTTSPRILVFELDTGKILEVLDLGDRLAKQISITTEFGFITAFCDGLLISFTENGTEMYRTEFPFDVTHFCSPKTFNGRDFIVFTTRTNEIAYFEVFRPTVKIVGRMGNLPTSLIYSLDMLGLCYITEDAWLHFLPFWPS
jgi:hypothetical protein